MNVVAASICKNAKHTIPHWYFALTYFLTAQSVEDITRIVREARLLPPAPGWDKYKQNDDWDKYEQSYATDEEDHKCWGAPQLDPRERAPAPQAVAGAPNTAERSASIA